MYKVYILLMNYVFKGEVESKLLIFLFSDKIMCLG